MGVLEQKNSAIQFKLNDRVRPMQRVPIKLGLASLGSAKVLHDGGRVLDPLDVLIHLDVLIRSVEIRSRVSKTS